MTHLLRASLGFLVIVNSAFAATYRAEGGTLVRLSLGDAAHFSLPRERRVNVTFVSCDSATNTGIFEVVKRSRAGRQESSITVGVDDSGFAVEVLKLTCTSVETGEGEQAVGGAALITVAVSTGFAS